MIDEEKFLTMCREELNDAESRMRTALQSEYDAEEREADIFRWLIKSIDQKSEDWCR